MAVVILTLIEINERIKKRKKTDVEEPKEPKDCVEQDCSGCALVEHCEERRNERVKE